MKQIRNIFTLENIINNIKKNIIFLLKKYQRGIKIWNQTEDVPIVEGKYIKVPQNALIADIHTEEIM